MYVKMFTTIKIFYIIIPINKILNLKGVCRMSLIGRIVSQTTGGIVGGAAGASALTGVGLVVGGPVGAAIGFGLGSIGGTAAGAIAGNELTKKVEKGVNK
jgi:hypothetical protein